MNICNNGLIPLRKKWWLYDKFNLTVGTSDFLIASGKLHEVYQSNYYTSDNTYSASAYRFSETVTRFQTTYDVITLDHKYVPMVYYPFKIRIRRTATYINDPYNPQYKITTYVDAYVTRKGPTGAATEVAAGIDEFPSEFISSSHFYVRKQLIVRPYKSYPINLPIVGSTVVFPSTNEHDLYNYITYSGYWYDDASRTLTVNYYQGPPTGILKNVSFVLSENVNTDDIHIVFVYTGTSVDVQARKGSKSGELTGDAIPGMIPNLEMSDGKFYIHQLWR